MSLLKECKADKLQVKVFDTRLAMGKAAGKDAAEKIRALLKEKSEVNIIFAAAPSQNELLDALVEEPDIDWSRINAFHMDEYVGLDAKAPQCFSNFLVAHMFGRVPFKQVFLLNPAAEAQEECARYTKILQEYPVDLVCLGIGENAHIAFNDPGVAKFDDPCLVKTAKLDQVCRMQQVHDGCFASLEEVPTHAMTLTIPALTRAAHLVCVVPAPSKRQAVTATVYGPVTEDVPATIMRSHPDVTLYCDSDSGADVLARA